MLKHNLNLVRTSVTKLGSNMDRNSRNAVYEMAIALTQLTKEEIRTGRGEAKAGGPPVSRTGRLRGSIHKQVAKKGFAGYSAIVGPGVVYGRVLELGFSNGNKYPYMKPALIKFKQVAPAILRKHLLGKGI